MDFYILNANGQNMLCKRHPHVHGDAHLKVVIMLCLVLINKNGDAVKITVCLTNSKVVFLVTDLVLACKHYYKMWV